MDPRNPLGRLDQAARRSDVDSLSLRYDRASDGTLLRTVTVWTRDGARRRLVQREGRSFVELLDRLDRLLARAPSRRPRRPKESR